MALRLTARLGAKASEKMEEVRCKSNIKHGLNRLALVLLQIGIGAIANWQKPLQTDS